MATSENDDVQSLHEKLGKIQLEISAPKSQFNKFGNYYHRNVEDILEAFKKVSRGTYLTLNDEVVEIAQRVYIKATATISDGKDSISACAYAREALQKKGMDDSQVTGSASSYARKYALGGLLGVDDNKDADTMDNASDNAKAPPPQRPTHYKQTFDTQLLRKKTEFKEQIKKCDDVNKLSAIYKEILAIFGPYKDKEEVSDFLMDVVDLCKTRKLELEEQN